MPPEQVLGKITSQPFHKIRWLVPSNIFQSLIVFRFQVLILSFFFNRPMQSPALLEHKTAVLKVQVRKNNLKYPIRLRSEKSLLSKPHLWRGESMRQFGFNTKANLKKKKTRRY